MVVGRAFFQFELAAAGAAGDATAGTGEAGAAAEGGAAGEAGDAPLDNGGCFVAGTLVTMADGAEKPIEQVKAGDRVESQGLSSDKSEPISVMRTKS